MSKGPLKLFSGSSHPELANKIAKQLGQEVEPLHLGRFANNEVDVQLQDSVRGCDTYVIQTCTENVDNDLMEAYAIINAIKHGKAQEIHAVIPHFGYARSDSMSEHDKRKPIMAQMVAQMLGTAGATHAMVFNLHSRQAQGFFPWPMDNLFATKLLMEDLKSKHLDGCTLVAPDAGAAKSTEYVAKRMGLPWAVINKFRPRPNESKVTKVVGDVEGKICVLFDDMIDTAGTTVNARIALLNGKAKDEMYAYATHPVLSNPATSRLREAGFREVVVTDTIPVPEEKRFPGLRTLSVSTILAKVIKDIHDAIPVEIQEEL